MSARTLLLLGAVLASPALRLPAVWTLYGPGRESRDAAGTSPRDDATLDSTPTGGGKAWLCGNSDGPMPAAAIRAAPLIRPCTVGKQLCAGAAAAGRAARHGAGLNLKFSGRRSYLCTHSQGTQFSPAALIPCAGVQESNEHHRSKNARSQVLVLPVTSHHRGAPSRPAAASKTDDVITPRGGRRAGKMGSILIACPAAAEGFPAEYISMTWMRSLRNETGVQVDYTFNLLELNRSRIFRYSALLLFQSPATIQSPPASAAGFPALLGEFVHSGGGLFLYPSETNWRTQMLPDVTAFFGLRMPVEVINETNPANVGELVRFNGNGGELAFTDAVATCTSRTTEGSASSGKPMLSAGGSGDGGDAACHPTLRGVKQLWYPFGLHYNAGETAPLCLTSAGPSCDGPSNWTALVRASKTAVTHAIDAAHAKYLPLPQNHFHRTTPVRSPPIFAVRLYGAGRVAAMSQWHQYTIGSGNKWLFNSTALRAGLQGRPSDLGVLLTNTVQWLAKPTAGGPGGFVDSQDSLVYPNDRLSEREKFAEKVYNYSRVKLSDNPANPGLVTTRGIIGARTALSTGTGSVEDFAKAAVTAKLGFVVFTEEWSQVEGQRTLSNESLMELKRDCKRYSTDSLQLIPGYAIRNNIGNRQIFLGPGVPVPPPDSLTADGSQILLQGVTSKSSTPTKPGHFSGYNTPSFNWMLSAARSTRVSPDLGWTVGYYSLGEGRTPGSLSMPDLRCYSMAATVYYDSNGTLVEDLEADLKTTVESTITPVPVAVSEVLSPKALVDAASNQMLTHVTLVSAPLASSNTSSVFMDGLRWNSQYDSLPTFVSHTDGPLIDMWPTTNRVYTLGAERFVTGSALLPANISLKAQHGATISNVTITNGRRLFRRFTQCNVSQFYRTLLLDGYVHKNLILVVVDSAGRRSYGSPLRSWKPGPRSVVFCGDHVNDCTDAVELSHGPISPPAVWTPNLPVDLAGYTWDGGPSSTHPLIKLGEARPSILQSSEGVELGTRFTQVPHLEYTDEGGTAIASSQSRVFASNVDRVVNPWHTYGPLAGPSKLFNFTIHYRMWFEASISVPESAYPGMPLDASNTATLFRSDILFKTMNQITSMQLLSGAGTVPDVLNLYLAVAQNATAAATVYEPSAVGFKSVLTDAISAGGWWALWSDELSQAQLFINRGDDVAIKIASCTLAKCAGNWFRILAPVQFKVQAGDSMTVEFAQIGESLLVTEPINSLEGALKLRAFITTPPGMRITRGVRLASAAAAGLLEVSLDDAGAAALHMPRTADPYAVLPLRFEVQSQRWTAGLWQLKGYMQPEEYYGGPADRWTALGISWDGHSHAPLYTGLAETDIVFGHPVTAVDGAGAGNRSKDVFIQVTHTGQTWVVSINNPTQEPITLRLSKGIPIAALYVPTAELTVGAGELLILDQAPNSSITKAAAIKTDERAHENVRQGEQTNEMSWLDAPPRPSDDFDIFRMGDLGFSHFRIPVLATIEGPTPALVLFAEARKFSFMDWGTRGLVMRATYDGERER
eukprot:SAG22_NODE_60_length_23423_cov_8.445250_5_plen_1524_part_00